MTMLNGSSTMLNNSTLPDGDLDHAIPTVADYYLFEFEKHINRQFMDDWFKVHWSFPYVWTMVYLVVIFGGQSLMKHRPRFELKYPLAAWNFVLAVFSIIAAIRFIPHMYRIINEQGFMPSVCNINSYLPYTVATSWSFVFALSKIPEFGDTLFIVLRKQKLIFLHWYHHVTVVFVTWYNTIHFTSTGPAFISMNLVAHSLMYAYYFLRALGYKVPRGAAMCITLVQLSQMVIGSYVNLYAYRMKESGLHCDVPYSIIIGTISVYLSYFVLFANFFYGAYFKRGRTDTQIRVGQNGYTKVDQNGYTKVDQNGYAKADQNGYAKVDQNRYSKVDQNGHTKVKAS